MVAVVPGSITLRLETSRQVTIPADAIESIKVRIGRHPRSRGAAIGAGIGLFLGAGLAVSALEWPCVAEDCYRNLAGFVLGVAVSPVVRREGVGLVVAVSF